MFKIKFQPLIPKIQFPLQIMLRLKSSITQYITYSVILCRKCFKVNKIFGILLKVVVTLFVLIKSQVAQAGHELCSRWCSCLCWDYRNVPPYSLYLYRGTQTMTSCMLCKNFIPSPNPRSPNCLWLFLCCYHANCILGRQLLGYPLMEVLSHVKWYSPK